MNRLANRPCAGHVHGPMTPPATPTRASSIVLSFLAEVLALSDELEFAAIQAIHSQLDDNSDGKVDLSESEEVLKNFRCCLNYRKSEIFGAMMFHRVNLHCQVNLYFLVFISTTIFLKPLYIYIHCPPPSGSVASEWACALSSPHTSLKRVV